MKLTYTELHLLSLTLLERSGREIAQLFKTETGKTITYGTLYVTLSHLKGMGLVSMRTTEDEDGPIRWFKITDAGDAVLRENLRSTGKKLLDAAFGGGQGRTPEDTRSTGEGLFWLIIFGLLILGVVATLCLAFAGVIE